MIEMFRYSNHENSIIPYTCRNIQEFIKYNEIDIHLLNELYLNQLQLKSFIFHENIE